MSVNPNLRTVIIITLGLQYSNLRLLNNLTLYSASSKNNYFIPRWAEEDQPGKNHIKHFQVFFRDKIRKFIHI